jgi:hypothetical protein
MAFTKDIPAPNMAVRKHKSSDGAMTYISEEKWNLKWRPRFDIQRDVYMGCLASYSNEALHDLPVFLQHLYLPTRDSYTYRTQYRK